MWSEKTLIIILTPCHSQSHLTLTYSEVGFKYRSSSFYPILDKLTPLLRPYQTLRRPLWEYCNLQLDHQASDKSRTSSNVDQLPYSLKSISQPLPGRLVEMIMPSRSRTYQALANASRSVIFLICCPSYPRNTHLVRSHSFTFPLKDFTIPPFLLSVVLQNLL